MANQDSPIPGAHDKIATLRQRHAQVIASVDYYEGRLAEQQTQLGKLNRSRGDYMDEDVDEAEEAPEPVTVLTEEDLRREEEEVRQLEKKKRELESRVQSMSRDISGLR
ncbi:DASH complex protein [Pyrenophora tritici-repentis]|uniref:DASH complex subunit SPC34 n=1 Tax=Pyrenophora tritici-repentis TaxID=45151 RepID=A0A922NNF6_9PLEO|nr:DASH complex protein [Pyrenophora tritici-repentis]KAI1673391.1 DASH complex protein [Pyrenophora tritici-repentis]